VSGRGFIYNWDFFAIMDAKEMKPSELLWKREASAASVDGGFRAVRSLPAEALKDDKHIDLKEIVLRKHHPWNGQAICDLDISRQTSIVMVKRNGTMLVPKGELVLLEGDHVIWYSQIHMADAVLIRL